jgi:hypothetical protein
MHAFIQFIRFDSFNNNFLHRILHLSLLYTHALFIGKKAYIYIGESTTRATSKPTNRNAGAFWYRTVVLIVV